MKLDDILFCLMDAIDDYEQTDNQAESIFLPNDLEVNLYVRKLHEQYTKKTAAIKEVVSLLLLIRDSEGVELTAEPDGIFYEAAGRYGVRLGTIMKEADSNAGIH